MLWLNQLCGTDRFTWNWTILTLGTPLARRHSEILLLSDPIHPDNMFLPIDHKIELWPPPNQFAIKLEHEICKAIEIHEE